MDCLYGMDRLYLMDCLYRMDRLYRMDCLYRMYGMDRPYPINRPYCIQYREKVATNDPIVVMCLLSSKFVQKFMQRGDLVQLQSRRHRLGMTGVSEAGGQGVILPPSPNFARI